jgi:outer membrane protein insertion porin family
MFHERNFDITRFPTSGDDIVSGRAFRGGGQQLTLEAAPGNELQRYVATWRDPFLLNTRLSLGVSAYYRTERFLEYEDTRLGTTMSLGRQFGDFWAISAGIRAEQVGVDNVQPYAPPDYLDVVGDHFITGFRAGAAYDDRDSFIRPTIGQRVDLSLEQVVGDFSYPLATLAGSKFITVAERPDRSGKQVLVLRSEVGFAGDETPVFDRFFGGGLRSIRGFSYRGVGPQANGLMVGGDFKWFNSIEYQFPIVASDNVFMVAFVDSGTVESDVEITTYRVAAGAGFRMIIPGAGGLPITPFLGFDFAFPIVKADGDIEQIFSFQVGFNR